MTPMTARTMLRATALIFAAFGPFTALPAIPQFAGPLEAVADFLALPLDGAQQIEGPGPRFLAAVAGGVITGFGLMIWHLAGRVQPGDAGGQAATIRLGAISWCIVDSGFSVAAGAASNAGFNALILAALLIPLQIIVRTEPAATRT